MPFYIAETFVFGATLKLSVYIQKKKKIRKDERRENEQRGNPYRILKKKKNKTENTQAH